MASPPRLGMKLGDRETVMLNFASHGMTAKQIADSMGLAVHTVQTYAHNIRVKLGGYTTTHCVAIALRRGIIK
jgi:DNA-binding NarL/FixJ family response regulator